MQHRNRLAIDGCYGRYPLEENEPLTAELCNDLIVEAQSVGGILNLDILVPLFRISTERLILEAHGFSYAGSQQKNEEGRARDYCIFRYCVRSARDGVAAFGNTTLAPTSFE